MSTFDAAIAWVLPHEGGYQASTKDAGNYYHGRLLGTNWGISAPVAVAHGWDPNVSLRTMPQSFALAVYRSDYWPGLEGITSENVAAKILDMRLSGKARADRYVQQGLVDMGWQIAIDGSIGPMTQSALNHENEAAVLQMLAEQHAAIYQDSADQNPGEETWLAGWMNRAADIPSLAVVAGGLSLVGLMAAGVLVWLAVKA